MTAAAGSELLPRYAATRLAEIQKELNNIAEALHRCDLPIERDHVERAAEECDYAIDGLAAIVRGDD